MYTVYAIKSLSRNYIYVWLTNNIERRFSEHNSWKSKTTRPYCPFILIYSECCDTRIMAREREKYFKSWCWKEYLKKL